MTTFGKASRWPAEQPHDEPGPGSYDPVPVSLQGSQQLLPSFVQRNSRVEEQRADREEKAAQVASAHARMQVPGHQLTTLAPPGQKATSSRTACESWSPNSRRAASSACGIGSHLPPEGGDAQTGGRRHSCSWSYQPNSPIRLPPNLIAREQNAASVWLPTAPIGVLQQDGSTAPATAAACVQVRSMNSSMDATLAHTKLSIAAAMDSGTQAGVNPATLTNDDMLPSTVASMPAAALEATADPNASVRSSSSLFIPSAAHSGRLSQTQVSGSMLSQSLEPNPSMSASTVQPPTTKHHTTHTPSKLPVSPFSAAAIVPPLSFAPAQAVGHATPRDDAAVLVQVSWKRQSERLAVSHSIDVPNMSSPAAVSNRSSICGTPATPSTARNSTAQHATLSMHTTDKLKQAAGALRPAAAPAALTKRERMAQYSQQVKDKNCKTRMSQQADLRSSCASSIIMEDGTATPAVSVRSSLQLTERSRPIYASKAPPQKTDMSTRYSHDIAQRAPASFSKLTVPAMSDMPGVLRGGAGGKLTKPQPTSKKQPLEASQQQQPLPSFASGAGTTRLSMPSFQPQAHHVRGWQAAAMGGSPISKGKLYAPGKAAHSIDCDPPQPSASPFCTPRTVPGKRLGVKTGASMCQETDEDLTGSTPTCHPALTPTALRLAQQLSGEQGAGTVEQLLHQLALHNRQLAEEQEQTDRVDKGVSLLEQLQAIVDQQGQQLARQSVEVQGLQHELGQTTEELLRLQDETLAAQAAEAQAEAAKHMAEEEAASIQSTAEQRIVALELALAAEKLHVSALEQQLADSLGEVALSGNERDDTTLQLVSLTAEINVSHNRLSQVHCELEEEKTKHNRTRQKAAATERQLHALQQDHKQTIDSVAVLHVQVGCLQAKCEAGMKSLLVTQSEHVAVASLAGDLAAQLTELKAAHAALVQDSAAVLCAEQTAHSHAKDAAADLEKQLSQLQAAHAAAMHDMHVKLTAEQAMSKCSQAEVARLQAELQSVQAEHASAAQSWADVKSGHMEALQAANAALSTQQTEHVAVAAALVTEQEQNKRLCAANDALQAQVAELQSQHKGVIEQLTELQLQYKSAAEQLQAEQSQHKGVAEQLAELEMQHKSVTQQLQAEQAQHLAVQQAQVALEARVTVLMADQAISQQAAAEQLRTEQAVHAETLQKLAKFTSQWHDVQAAQSSLMSENGQKEQQLEQVAEEIRMVKFQLDAAQLELKQEQISHKQECETRVAVQQELQGLMAEYTRLQAQLQASTAEHLDTQHQLDTVRAAHNQGCDKLSAVWQELQDTRTKVQDMQTQHQSMQTQCTCMEAQLQSEQAAKMEAQLTLEKERAAKMGAQLMLEKEQAAHATAQASLAAAEQQVHSLSLQLATAHTEHAHAVQQCIQAEAQGVFAVTNVLESKLAELQAQNTAALEAAATALSSLQSQHAAAVKALNVAQKECEHMAAALSTEQAEHSVARELVCELQATLSAREADFSQALRQQAISNTHDLVVALDAQAAVLKASHVHELQAAFDGLTAAQASTQQSLHGLEAELGALQSQHSAAVQEASVVLQAEQAAHRHTQQALAAAECALHQAQQQLAEASVQELVYISMPITITPAACEQASHADMSSQGVTTSQASGAAQEEEEEDTCPAPGDSLEIICSRPAAQSGSPARSYLATLMHVRSVATETPSDTRTLAQLHTSYPSGSCTQRAGQGVKQALGQPAVANRGFASTPGSPAFKQPRADQWKVSELQAEMEAQAAELLRLSTHLTAADSQAHSSSIALLAEQARSARLTQQLSVVTNALRSMEAHAMDMAAAATQLQEECRLLQECKRSDDAHYVAELSALQANLVSLQAAGEQAAEDAARVQECEATIQQLQQEVDSLSSQLAAAHRRAETQARASVQQMDVAVNEMAAQLQALAGQLEVSRDSAAVEASSLRQELAATRRAARMEVDTLQARLDTAMAAYEAARATADGLQQAADELQGSMSPLEPVRQSMTQSAGGSSTDGMRASRHALPARAASASGVIETHVVQSAARPPASYCLKRSRQVLLVRAGACAPRPPRPNRPGLRQLLSSSINSRSSTDFDGGSIAGSNRGDGAGGGVDEPASRCGDGQAIDVGELPEAAAATSAATSQCNPSRCEPPLPAGQPCPRCQPGADLTSDVDTPSTHAKQAPCTVQPPCSCGAAGASSEHLAVRTLLSSSCHFVGWEGFTQEGASDMLPVEQAQRSPLQGVPDAAAVGMVSTDESSVSTRPWPSQTAAVSNQAVDNTDVLLVLPLGPCMPASTVHTGLDATTSGSQQVQTSMPDMAAVAASVSDCPSSARPPLEHTFSKDGTGGDSTAGADTVRNTVGGSSTMAEEVQHYQDDMSHIEGEAADMAATAAATGIVENSGSTLDGATEQVRDSVASDSSTSSGSAGSVRPPGPFRRLARSSSSSLKRLMKAWARWGN